jgi:hypothetical protein
VSVEVAPASELLALDLPPKPYPGLRPFEMFEWSIFFGREPMIDEIIGLLGRQSVVVVHGSSGSGKSSLIRAGVLPRLARQHRRYRIPWLSCAIRPSGGPLWNLASALAELEAGQPDLVASNAIRREFDRPGARLADIIAGRPALAGKRVCILIDQFEEIFRYAREVSREEVEVMVDLLRSVIEDERSDPALHVLVTMRSEFLGDCGRFPELAQAINRAQYLLPPMDHASLLRAIRRPAELYGGTVEESLAERLISDGRGEQDALPLIQHALMLLWNRATPPDSPQSADSSSTPARLHLEQYEGQGGLKQMLSDHADRVMQSVAAETGRQGARIIELLFRALTDINAEGLAIRNPRSLRRLCAVIDADKEAIRKIIDAFRADGTSFLTPYAPAPIGRDTEVDISHEALIRSWTRISNPGTKTGWLHAEFRDGQDWRILRARSLENVEISPAALPDRERWLAKLNPAWSERYGGGWADVQRLMALSRAKRTRTRATRLLTAAAVMAVAAYAYLYQQNQARYFEKLAARESSVTAALQESLRNSKAVNLWQPLVIVGADQKLPLLSVAQADPDLRDEFVRVMLHQPDFARRFSRDSTISRALVGISTARRDLVIKTLRAGQAPRTSAAVAAIARAALELEDWSLVLDALNPSDQRLDDDALILVGQAAASLGSSATPNQKEHALGRIIPALESASNAAVLRALAAAIAALNPTSDQSARAVNRLIAVFQESRDSDDVLDLAKGIATLNPTTDQAAQAVGRLISQLQVVSDDDSVYTLTQGIVTLGPTTDQAVQAVDLLASGRSACRFSDDARAQSLAMLRPKISVDAAGKVVARFTALLERAVDPKGVVGPAECIAALDPTSEQAAPAVSHLFALLEKSTVRGEAAWLAQGITALGSKFSADQAARTIIILSPVLENTTEAFELASLATAIAQLNPTSEQARRAASHLLAVYDETVLYPLTSSSEDAGRIAPRNLRLLAPGIAALGPKLSPDQAVQTISGLISILERAKHSELLASHSRATEIIGALAPMLSAEQAAQAVIRLAAVLERAPAVLEQRGSFETQALTQAIATLAVRLLNDQAAAVLLEVFKVPWSSVDPLRDALINVLKPAGQKAQSMQLLVSAGRARLKNVVGLDNPPKPDGLADAVRQAIAATP